MLRKIQAIISGHNRLAQVGVSNYDLLRQAATHFLSSQSITNGLNKVELDCVVQDVSESTPMPSGEPSVSMTVGGFGEPDERIQVVGTGQLAANFSKLLPGAQIRVAGRLGAKQRPPLEGQLLSPHPQPTQQRPKGDERISPRPDDDDAISSPFSEPPLKPQQQVPPSPMSPPLLVPYIQGVSVQLLPIAESQLPAAGVSYSGSGGRGAGGGDSPAGSQDEAALWEALRRNPEEWYDNRRSKMGKQPDFKRRDKSAALWIGSRNAPQWLSEWLVIRDGARGLASSSATSRGGPQLHGRGRGQGPEQGAGGHPAAGGGRGAPRAAAGAQRPLTLAAKREEEATAWEALRGHPEGWHDNRNSKTSPRAPDFTRKDGTGSLWTTSYNRPLWLNEWLAERDGGQPASPEQ